MALRDAKLYKIFKSNPKSIITILKYIFPKNVKKVKSKLSQVFKTAQNF